MAKDEDQTYTAKRWESYRCCTAVVVGWSVGGWVGGEWRVLGGWRLARDPRDGGGS